MDNYLIEYIKEKDLDEVAVLWEASVRDTHHFLTEEDIIIYCRLLRDEYLRMVRLYGVKIGGKIAGFIGIADGAIEMLFVHPLHFGKGVGKALAQFAISGLGCRRVDVNEQNREALLFYIKSGFSISGRSEADGLGKPYPLFHLQLEDKPASIH